ncbi:CYTH domain-containing protein [Microbacterium yannicii]|uniref:CYTH domain-containing protein n=1 Tax=Microbacterium yannicii TaxID=671622 RepID=UPI0002E314D3|nr:CYTH domain-containing protein [Microbacterium yannicii]
MTGGDIGPSRSAGSRSVEVELKFDVDAGVARPDWSAVPGVASVTAGERRELDAVYLDDAGLSLARAGFALRRRTGGPDAGWHIKGPRGADGGRVELQWPLGEPSVPPEGALSELAAVTRGPFLPLARIRNERTVFLLLNESGGVLAEFADDRVRTRDERSGAEREWQEWEVELGAAAPADADGRAAFFAAVTDAALAAGARSAASDSKLARALGH